VSVFGVIGVQGVQFWFFGYNKVEWNSVAASLAVITAIISAWTTQTSFERQEEARRPYPYPTLDAYSRTSLFQLRLTNMGASTAYDIRLQWNQPILNMEAKPVRFSQGDPEVPLLLPSQSIVALIDVGSNFLSKHKDAEYSGVVEFKDNPRSNTIFRHEFYISAEMYRGLPRYVSAEQETRDKLQKLPDAINGVTTELNRLRNDFEEAYKLGEQDEMLTDEELAVECAAKRPRGDTPDIPG
jgi:hypothetical protein